MDLVSVCSRSGIKMVGWNSAMARQTVPPYTDWWDIRSQWTLPGNNGDTIFDLQFVGQNAAPWPGYIPGVVGAEDDVWQPPVWNCSLKALCLIQQGLYQFIIGGFLKGDLRGPFRLQLLFKDTALNDYLYAFRIMTYLDMNRYRHWRYCQNYHWACKIIDDIQEAGCSHFERYHIRHDEIMQNRWKWFVPPDIPRSLWRWGARRPWDPQGDNADNWVRYFPNTDEWSEEVGYYYSQWMYDPGRRFLHQGGHGVWECHLGLDEDDRDFLEMNEIVYHGEKRFAHHVHHWPSHW